MEIMNLVVTGTVGAGKTTFIRSVSEIEVVDTDRKATDDVANLKQNTTVSMDFGTLQFGDEMALHIYGTPGQTRFDFMWEILIERAHAYVLLIAAHRPSEFHHARRIMNFMNRQANIPMIIGLPPQHADRGSEGVRKDLERIGIFETMKDGRVNLPDLYRVGFGLGRRGGVPPIK